MRSSTRSHPLVDDPAVQALIIDETMDGITAQVDFDQLTANVFDGIAELGLPPRAEQALGLLQAPAADGLENLVTQTVTRVVESDAFADVWATATRAAHRALTTAATSDGGGLVVKTDDGVGIQLGAVVERVKQNLLDRGLGVAQLIPTIDKVVIIGEGEQPRRDPHRLRDRSHAWAGGCRSSPSRSSVSAS